MDGDLRLGTTYSAEHNADAFLSKTVELVSAELRVSGSGRGKYLQKLWRCVVNLANQVKVSTYGAA